jgi:hypothetical protein
VATRSTPPKEFPWNLYYCDLYFDYKEILEFLKGWCEVPEFSELLEVLKPLEEVELELAVSRCLWLKSYFDRLREILAVSPEEAGGSRMVMQRVCDLLNEISPLVAEEPLLEQIIDRVVRYGSGLFHCYDDPRIPKTNNNLEHSHHKFKREKRRVMGGRENRLYVELHGPFAAVAQNYCGQAFEEKLELIRAHFPSREALRGMREKHEILRMEHRETLRIRKQGLQKTLQEVEEKLRLTINKTINKSPYTK